MNLLETVNEVYIEMLPIWCNASKFRLVIEDGKITKVLNKYGEEVKNNEENYN